MAEDVIEIRPEIMQLLETFGKTRVVLKKNGSTRGLAQLKIAGKKRSRE